ncbi:hypothetical protein HC766_05440 [Candidatus Gracilibacteria bacterium]|nr:hypothetical protein [Candidatus Gracilibacteria bacterium]
MSGLTDNEIREIITKKSSEVEGIKYVWDYFGGKVVVGQITNLRNHPDADRLKIFDADLGTHGLVQIVTAAPNVYEGMIVPIAMVGANLPDFVITERKMRGELSCGMVCGKSELLLETKNSSGVWDLEKDLISDLRIPKLGQSICEIFPDYFPKEVLFDVKVLPNRISVFGSYLGMSLELAMILGDYELLKEPALKLLNNEEVYKKVIRKMNRISNKKFNSKIILALQTNLDFLNLFWMNLM